MVTSEISASETMQIGIRTMDNMDNTHQTSTVIALSHEDLVWTSGQPLSESC